jgi:hypothetical protein
MTTDGHYTGFWVKDAIATIACATCLVMGVSACNDSNNLLTSAPNQTPTASPTNPLPDDGFSLNSLINSLEGAKSGVTDAVAPHADAVQARTKEEVEKLFRWEYKVVDSPSTEDSANFELLLTGLGNEGWECFDINHLTPGTVRITCKRRPKSAISYLKYIPGL